MVRCQLEEGINMFFEELGDKCAVMAVCGHSEILVRARDCLSNGNHRGQEGSGMTIANGEKILTQKGQGLVSEVYSERSSYWHALRIFPKPLFVIGHNRYSTMGYDIPINLQPVVVRLDVFGPNRHFPETVEFSVCSNGHVVNMEEQRVFLSDHGANFATSVDIEVVGWSIAYHHAVGGLPIVEAIGKMMQHVRGAYSGMLATPDTLYVYRDFRGFRPLTMGENPIAFASETCMLDSIGSRVVRDVKPGEVVKVDRNGKVYSYQVAEPQQPTLCDFEYIYFARPDSYLGGIRVEQARKQAGAFMIKKYPALDANLVSFLPETAESAAIGAHHASGLPFERILIKNRYGGRGFIRPVHEERKAVARMCNPLTENFEGKVVVIFEDSIVRGTTLKELIRILFAKGAKKIYLYICSAPYSHGCYFGVDTCEVDDLLTHQWAHLPVEVIEKNVAEYLDCEGTTRLVVRYLRVEEYEEAYGMRPCSSCRGCFTGIYPVPIPSKAPKKGDFEQN